MPFGLCLLLEYFAGLPEVPSNVTASERGYNRAVVTVTWSNSDSGSDDLLFVLEERHHVGRRLSPRRLGPWAALHRGAEAQCVLPRGTLRPGRWYEFRVAAVSANGSRGFSEPSQPFKLSARKRLLQTLTNEAGSRSSFYWNFAGLLFGMLWDRVITISIGVLY